MNRLSCTALILFLAAVIAPAQDINTRAVEVKGLVGWAGFPDESTLHHFVGGGSVRMYITPRLSFEPELLYMRGPGFDRDLVFIPNIAFDFARTQRVRPYVIGGVGLLRHRDGIRNSPTGVNFYWGNGMTIGGGVGVKVFLSERLFITPEFRIGWEPVLRTTVGIGYRF